MTSSNSRPSSNGMTPATSRATTREEWGAIEGPRFGVWSTIEAATMSVHSWTLRAMTVRPWGIQARSTVTPRIDSQQTYRPHAAVYSSWILELPVQKDISQRP
ncbi:hypothetical protein FQN60_013797, partial [Etheostoma spectabile]